MKNTKNKTLIEYACYDEPVTDEVKKNVFRAIDLGVNVISVPMVHAGTISEFMLDGMILSCPIDWPNGRQDTELRIHAMTKAANKGANAVDIVANHVLFLNKHEADFIRDVKTLLDVGKNRGMSVRFMADHRKMANGRQFKGLLETLNKAGVEFVICSTGQYVEDYSDNILMCKAAEKLGLDAICNGNLYLPKHLKAVQDAELFGARFHNINGLENSLAGV